MTVYDEEKFKLLTSRDLVLVAQYKNNYNNVVGQKPKS